MITLRRDQLIAESLVIPLAVVVRHKLVDESAQTSLAEEDHSIETFFTERAHEPLRVGIGIRRLNRRLHDAHAGVFDGAQIGRDTSELQSHVNLVCRLLLEKKKKKS